MRKILPLLLTLILSLLLPDSYGQGTDASMSGTNQFTGSAHCYFWVDKLAALKNLLKQDV